MCRKAARSVAARNSRKAPAGRLATEAARIRRSCPRSTGSVARRQCAHRAPTVSANPPAAIVITAQAAHANASNTRALPSDAAGESSSARYVATITPPAVTTAAATAGT